MDLSESFQECYLHHRATFNSFFAISWCFLLFCYVFLRLVLSWFVLFCLSCHIPSYPAMSSHLMLYHAFLCQFIFLHLHSSSVTLFHFMWFYFTLVRFDWPYFTLGHFRSLHVTLVRLMSFRSLEPFHVTLGHFLSQI
jgi:hypothetical protein